MPRVFGEREREIVFSYTMRVWLAFRECGLLDGAVNMVLPDAYVVSDAGGDVGGADGQGLFYKDEEDLVGMDVARKYLQMG